MASNTKSSDASLQVNQDTPTPSEKEKGSKAPTWKRFFGGPKLARDTSDLAKSSDEFEEIKSRPEKWSMGVLNDRETEEVPGTWVLI